MGDTVDMEDESHEHPCESFTTLKAAAYRASSDISHSMEEKLSLATRLIRGHLVVEVPGEWN